MKKLIDQMIEDVAGMKVPIKESGNHIEIQLDVVYKRLIKKGWRKRRKK